MDATLQNLVARNLCAPELNTAEAMNKVQRN
jgi:hypothetical protein